MFDDKSRYAGVETYETTDRRGRRVRAVFVPAQIDESPVGRHILREGERLDHLANLYLFNPTGYWRICDMNDAMLPDALAEREELFIPAAGRPVPR